MKSVTVYSRTGCHLCETAIAQIESVKSDLNFNLEIKLIDGNLDLEKQQNLIKLNEIKRQEDLRKGLEGYVKFDYLTKKNLGKENEFNHKFTS